MARALLDDLERSKLGGKSPEGRERTSRCGQFIGSACTFDDSLCTDISNATAMTIEDVYNTLDDIAHNGRRNLGLQDKTEIKINGFDGSRNTGDTHAWFAIYNNSHPNQKTAKQLFFSVQDGKVSCALYNRRTNEYIEQEEIALTSNK